MFQMFQKLAPCFLFIIQMKKWKWEKRGTTLPLWPNVWNFARRWPPWDKPSTSPSLLAPTSPSLRTPEKLMPLLIPRRLMWRLWKSFALRQEGETKEGERIPETESYCFWVWRGIFWERRLYNVWPMWEDLQFWKWSENPQGEKPQEFGKRKARDFERFSLCDSSSLWTSQVWSMWRKV